jgi:xylulokinase
MAYLLGIDLGSTSLKAVVYDVDGSAVAQAGRPMSSIAADPKHPQWQVYLPEAVWDGIAGAIREAVGQLGSPDQIRAAAVTGLGADAVPLDENGEPLYPFINWLCTRTAPQYEWWLANVGPEETFRVSGWQPFVWSTVLRFMWLRENEPELSRRVRKWLIIEDFVNYRLTGKYSTDYTDASPTLLFDQRKLTWSDELLASAGIERELLPTPQPSGSLIGEVTPAAANDTGLAPGTPIFQGGHDYLIGAVGAGVVESDIVLDVTGTWELVLRSTRAPRWTEEIRTLGLCLEAAAVPGAYCMWAAGTAGSMLEWCKDQIGLSAQPSPEGDAGAAWTQLMDEARSSPPGASGVYFLPHFNGITCPVSEPRALGAFLGLNDTTVRADLVRAVIEGLDYAFLEMLGAIEAGSGQPADKVVVVGGAARNEFWMQNKADVCGKPIETPMIHEATALGAAIMAGVAAGVYSDVQEGVQRTRRPGRIYEPNRQLEALYAELFEIYREGYPALRHVNRRIYDRFRLA